MTDRKGYPKDYFHHVYDSQLEYQLLPLAACAPVGAVVVPSASVQRTLHTLIPLAQ